MWCKEMKKTLLTSVAALFLATHTSVFARDLSGVDIFLGNASQLTCAQFNALGRTEADGAISWALGYLSAWHGLYAMRAEQEESVRDVAPELIARKARTKEIIQEIGRRCRKQPSNWFHLVVMDAYVSITKQ
jgi:hypothetical protein